MKYSRSTFVGVRDLCYHVREWGDPSAPKVLLLHGWMDVSASFQFMVDAMRGDWHVLAPDWRGFGLTQPAPDGYWFADYIADLDALVRHYSREAPLDIVGHSLGANVAMLYAGIRPERVHRLVALDGFGMLDDPPERAPSKFAAWLDALDDPPALRDYPNLGAVADRLQKNNRRLPRDKAEFLAGEWACVLPDGSARLRADPRHKIPFPAPYRLDDTLATWKGITAPVLWMAAAETYLLRWFDMPAAMTEIARRKTYVGQCGLMTIEDAGHMLHHDQPLAVARAIEAFLAGTPPVPHA